MLLLGGGCGDSSAPLNPSVSPAAVPPAPIQTALSSGPNVLLITVDTLRADHLGCYGSDLGASPHIDEWARRSVVFERPIAAAATFTLTYTIPPTTADFPAATRVDIQFEVENGNDPITWVRAGGELPDGLTLNSLGRLSGSALELGSFHVDVVARDVLGLLAEATITLEVGDPGISLSQLVSPFLGVGEELTSLQEDFLDHVGNGSGSYDLGDFRAWVLANPSR